MWFLGYVSYLTLYGFTKYGFLMLKFLYFHKVPSLFVVMNFMLLSLINYHVWHFCLQIHFIEHSVVIFGCICGLSLSLYRGGECSVTSGVDGEVQGMHWN